MYDFEVGDKVIIKKYWHCELMIDGMMYTGEQYFVGRTGVISKVRKTEDTTPYATGINYDQVSVIFDDDKREWQFIEWMLEKLTQN